MKIFTVFDAKAEAYLQPFFAMKEGVAMRNFSTAINTPEHQFNKFAEDYTLFYIGDWDEETCEILMLQAPQSLGNAITFLEKGEIPQWIDPNAG